MATAAESIKLRTLKTWISSDISLIFQCQPMAPRELGALPKKVHLTLDLKQQSFGARLNSEKPGDASANHAFIQILRKQCPSFTIKEILLDADSGNLWIPLLFGSGSQQAWRLRLVRSRPPLVSLVSPDDVIFVSYGQKGTFTKKHALDIPYPEGKLKNLMPELLQSLLLQEPSAEAIVEAGLDETDSEAEGESVTAKEPIPRAQREIANRLKRKQKTLKKTLDKLQNELPTAEFVKSIEQRAGLLQSYAYLLKPDALELRLDPALTGLDHELQLSVDPEKSRGAQIETAFQVFRKARRGREIGLQQIEQVKQQLSMLEIDLANLQAVFINDAERDALLRKYRLPEMSRPAAPGQIEGGAKAFKTYQASSGHSILVGKGAHENDELTKAARSNDYWFHAVGVTGSHVIVPVNASIRHALPTQLMREAAILALHFSRFKEDRAGECYVTRKNHLKKPKGMPPGLWRIDQSESFFFRYSEEDLQKLLQTIKI